MDNIDEATDRLQTITDDDYHKMIKEVEKWHLLLEMVFQLREH